MESINLESIINGNGSYMGLSSSMNGGTPSSSSSGLGSVGLLSSATSTDSLSLDDLPNSFHHMNHNHNHLTNDPNLHHHLSVTNHFTPSTNISSTSTSNNNNAFSLDQFDVDVSSCQLLQSYNLKDDDDYGLLDDDDLVGSFMNSGLHQDSIGQTITDHLTPAQFNLLGDCLDHITSSDALVSAAPSTSITTIPTSTALNHINNHNSHLNTNHIGTHQNDFSALNHSHYDASSIMGGFSDCGELSDDLNEHLGVNTSGNCSMVTSSQPLIRAATSNNHIQQGGQMVSSANVAVVATSNNNFVVHSLCSPISGNNNNNLLPAPIISTSNNNCATVVMPASTTTSLSPNLNTTTPNLTLVKIQEPSTSALKSQAAPSSLSVSTATPIATLVTPASAPTVLAAAVKPAAPKTSQPKAKPANAIKSESPSKAAPNATPGNNGQGTGGQAYSDEICRLTICPLCDVSKSFCSSSSVTRHLRSVHKLSDIPGTRNCYCLLCSRFLEDIPEFFNHLEKDHHVVSFHKPPKPLNSLYSRHHFKTFDDFLEWKTTTFEIDAGYKYERCFTNEYSRSTYFKCGAIRINRITMSGFKHSASTSSKPIVAIDSASKNSLVVSVGNQEGDEKKAEATVPDDMIIDSSYDNRMYPCTSTIRVVYRYSGLEVIVFPYHLGHRVVPEKKDFLLTSGTSNMNYLTSSSQVSGDTITTSTINPNTNQQIKTEVRLPFTVKMNNNSTSTTTNPTFAILPSKINTLVSTNATVTTPSNNNNNASTNLNSNNNNNNSNSNSKVNNNSKANRKRTREQQSTQTLTSKIVQPTSNTISVAATPKHNTNKTIKLQHGSGTKCTVATTTTGMVSAFSLTPTLGQLLSTSSALSSASSSSISATTGIPKIETIDSPAKLMKSPVSQSLDSIVNDIFVESPSYFDHHNQSMQIDRKGSSELVRVKENSEISPSLQAPTDASTTAGVMIKSYGTQSMGIKTEDFDDSKDSAIVVSTTNINAAVADDATDDKSFDNAGLMIVPIERGMQILQESLRPRKEKLRKRFNDLLESCLTETDMEQLENTVEQLISATL